MCDKHYDIFWDVAVKYYGTISDRNYHISKIATNNMASDACKENDCEEHIDDTNKTHFYHEL